MPIDYRGSILYKKVEAEPCPFCGCEEIQSYTYPQAGGWTVNVECTRCPAQMPSDNLQAALERWNTRNHLGVQQMRAHVMQVEWENRQLQRQMEEVKRSYRTDLAAVKRDDRIAAASLYEEQFRLAQQRAAMMEEALTVVKQSVERE